MSDRPRWIVLREIPMPRVFDRAPADLRAWLRVRASLRNRWMNAPCREPEWMRLLELIEAAEARSRTSS